MRANFVIMLFIVLLAWWNTFSNVYAQPALERLERQIRQRAETPDSSDSDAAGRSDVAAQEMRPAGENAKAGFLGAVADDQKDRGRGVRILSVHRGGPAEKAGLQKQDLLTALAGIRVRQMSEMSEILDTFAPGQSVDFEIQRDGKAQKIQVVLGQRPTTAQQRQDSSEAVPPPPGETILEPPEPQELSEPRIPAASRIELLERRVAELEGRVAELQRQMAEIAKKQQNIVK